MAEQSGRQRSIGGLRLPEERIDREALLDGLRNLHLGEWKAAYGPDHDPYDPERGDLWEIHWTLRFEFERGEPAVFRGCRVWPYNFPDLMNLLGLGPDALDGLGKKAEEKKEKEKEDPKPNCGEADTGAGEETEKEADRGGQQGEAPDDGEP